MDQLFYWSGVVLWATSGLFMSIALAQYLGMNIPGILRGDGWVIYKFGIGEIVIVRQEAAMVRMNRCGFYMHDGDGYWWCAKVFRVMV